MIFVVMVDIGSILSLPSFTWDTPAMFPIAITVYMVIAVIVIFLVFTDMFIGGSE
jgi:hypothetical protein